MIKKSIFKKYSATLAMIVILATALPFVACTKQPMSAEETNSITITTKASGELCFTLAGSGDVSISWGDGKKSNMNDAERWEGTDRFAFSHVYSNASAKNIVITGNVTSLDCYGSQLTALNVNSSTALTSLSCGGNQISDLDVSRNTALTSLDCHSNELIALDLSRNTALTNLDCRSNQLTDLDVSRNTALTSFDCRGNQLTVLDVSRNTALTVLDVCHNQITHLDVSTNTSLQLLCCMNNKFTASALNDLFRSLRSILPEPDYGIIDVRFSEPGYNSGIAEEKG